MAPPKFVEHQEPAPEAVVQAPATDPTSAPEYRPEVAKYEYYGEAPQEEPKKKVCGLPAKTFWILLILIVVLVIAGAVGGGVAGSKSKHHKKPKSAKATKTPSATKSATSSSATPTSTSAAFTVIEAIYAAQNITGEASPSLEKDSNHAVNMSKPDTDPFGGKDPWVGIKKCLSVLYQYNSSIRTYIGCDGDGLVSLIPEKNTQSQDITRQGPKSGQFAIVSVVWGAEEIRDRGIYETLSQYKSNGTDVPFENWLFGKDTLVGWSKSGVIWYTDDDFKTFKSSYAVEHSHAGFE